MSEKVKDIEVDINEATHAQLQHFAKVQNLDTDNAWSKSQLLAHIKKAWPEGTIKIPPTVEPIETYIPPELARSKDKVVILINASDDDPEGVIEGGVNGVSFRIQRNVEVAVSPEIYNVLKDAVTLHYDPMREGGLSKPRKVQAVPFTRLR